MANLKVSNAIFDAIDYIVDKKISEIPLDKTRVAIVEQCKNPSNGLHQLRMDTAVIAAYSQNNTIYKPGDSVYVLVPENNMSRDKIILGLTGTSRPTDLADEIKTNWITQGEKVNLISSWEVELNSTTAQRKNQLQIGSVFNNINKATTDALMISFKIKTPENLLSTGTYSLTFSFTNGPSYTFNYYDVIGNPYYLIDDNGNGVNQLILIPKYEDFFKEDKFYVHTADSNNNYKSAKLSNYNDSTVTISFNSDGLKLKDDINETEIANAKITISDMEIYCVNEGLEEIELSSTDFLINAPNGYGYDGADSLLFTATFPSAPEAIFHWFKPNDEAVRKINNWDITGMSGWAAVGSGANMAFPNPFVEVDSPDAEIELKCVAELEDKKVVVYTFKVQKYNILSSADTVNCNIEIFVDENKPYCRVYGVGKPPYSAQWIGLSADGGITSSYYSILFSGITDENKKEDEYSYIVPFADTAKTVDDLINTDNISILRCIIFGYLEADMTNLFPFASADIYLSEDNATQLTMQLSYINNVFKVDENGNDFPKQIKVYANRSDKIKQNNLTWLYTFDINNDDTKINWIEIPREGQLVSGLTISDEESSLTVEPLINNLSFNQIYIKACTNTAPYLEDIAAITKISDGSSNYDLILSNENIVIATDSSGNVINSQNDSIIVEKDDNATTESWYIETDIELYLGAANITISDEDITLPVFDDWVKEWQFIEEKPKTDNANYEPAKIRAYIAKDFQDTSLNWGTGSEARQYEIKINSPLAASVYWNWTKLPAGANGTSGKVLKLVANGPDNFKILKDSANPTQTIVFPSSDIQFNILKENAKVSSVWYKKDTDTNWIKYENTVVDKPLTADLVNGTIKVPYSKDWDSLSIAITEGNSFDGSSTTDFFDVVTVNKIIDGDSSFVVNADNDNFTILSSYNGFTNDADDAQVSIENDIEVFLGTQYKLQESDYKVEVLEKDPNDSSSVDPNPYFDAEVTWDSAEVAYQIRLTRKKDNNGVYVEIPSNINGGVIPYIVTIGNGDDAKIIHRKMTWSKQKAGQDGNDGWDISLTNEFEQVNVNPVSDTQWDAWGIEEWTTTVLVYKGIESIPYYDNTDSQDYYFTIEVDNDKIKPFAVIINNAPTLTFTASANTNWANYKDLSQIPFTIKIYQKNAAQNPIITRDVFLGFNIVKDGQSVKELRINADSHLYKKLEENIENPEAKIITLTAALTGLSDYNNVHWYFNDSNDEIINGGEDNPFTIAVDNNNNKNELQININNDIIQALTSFKIGAYYYDSSSSQGKNDAIYFDIETFERIEDGKNGENGLTVPNISQSSNTFVYDNGYASPSSVTFTPVFDDTQYNFIEWRLRNEDCVATGSNNVDFYFSFPIIKNSSDTWQVSDNFNSGDYKEFFSDDSSYAKFLNFYDGKGNTFLSNYTEININNKNELTITHRIFQTYTVELRLQNLQTGIIESYKATVTYVTKGADANRVVEFSVYYQSQTEIFDWTGNTPPSGSWETDTDWSNSMWSKDALSASSSYPFVYISKRNGEINDSNAWLNWINDWSTPVLYSMYASADITLDKVYNTVIPKDDNGNEIQGTYYKEYYINADAQIYLTEEQYNALTESEKANYQNCNGLFISASYLSSVIVQSDIIKSNGYSGVFSVPSEDDSANIFSPEDGGGTYLNLKEGWLRSPGVSWDNQGNAWFKGTIDATAGKFSNCFIKDFLSYKMEPYQNSGVLCEGVIGPFTSFLSGTDIVANSIQYGLSFITEQEKYIYSSNSGLYHRSGIYLINDSMYQKETLGSNMIALRIEQPSEDSYFNNKAIGVLPEINFGSEVPAQFLLRGEYKDNGIIQAPFFLLQTRKSTAGKMYFLTSSIQGGSGGLKLAGNSVEISSLEQDNQCTASLQLTSAALLNNTLLYKVINPSGTEEFHLAISPKNGDNAFQGKLELTNIQLWTTDIKNESSNPVLYEGANGTIISANGDQYDFVNGLLVYKR